jgi:hypothetical protein
MAAFGSNDARGAFIARTDEKLHGIVTWKCLGFEIPQADSTKEVQFSAEAVEHDTINVVATNEETNVTAAVVLNPREDKYDSASSGTDLYTLSAPPPVQGDDAQEGAVEEHLLGQFSRRVSQIAE